MVRRALGTRVMNFKACLYSFSPRAPEPENRPTGQLPLSSAEHGFPWTPQLEAACLSSWRARGFQVRLT